MAVVVADDEGRADVPRRTRAAGSGALVAIKAEANNGSFYVSVRDTGIVIAVAAASLLNYFISRLYRWTGEAPATASQQIT